MDYYEDTVRFEVECKTCSTSFHYLQRIGGFIAPKCPECGEEHNLKCTIEETTMKWKYHPVRGITTTTATADGQE